MVAPGRVLAGRRHRACLPPSPGDRVGKFNKPFPDAREFPCVHQRLPRQRPDNFFVVLLLNVEDPLDAAFVARVPIARRIRRAANDATQLGSELSGHAPDSTRRTAHNQRDELLSANKTDQAPVAPLFAYSP